MKNLVLFGPPGAGKGTQATFLKDTYNLIHISTGDVFRYNIKNKTDLGILAKSFMDKGELVPDHVTIDMLNAEVAKNLDSNGFIFDGFPRTVHQARALDKMLLKHDLSITGMLSLEVEASELRIRLRERGKTSGRKDDQDDIKIENRIKVYNDETKPVADYYKHQDKYVSIKGIGSIASIFQFITLKLDAFK